jgi:hypothetical protein
VGKGQVRKIFLYPETKKGSCLRLGRWFLIGREIIVSQRKMRKGFVNFDAPISNGGEETALSPMEIVLASLAACSSYHVVSILKKKRQTSQITQ